MVKNDKTHHEGTKENGDRIEFRVGYHVCVYSPKWVSGSWVGEDVFSSRLQELQDVKAATYPYPVLTNTPENNGRCSMLCQESSREINVPKFTACCILSFSSNSTHFLQKSVNYRTTDRLLGLDSLHKIYLRVLTD